MSSIPNSKQLFTNMFYFLPSGASESNARMQISHVNQTEERRRPCGWQPWSWRSWSDCVSERECTPAVVMFVLLWAVCQHPPWLDECALCMCSMMYLCLIVFAVDG